MNFKMLYIDGAWTPSASGAYIDVENPANKERFACVPEGNDADASIGTDGVHEEDANVF